MGIEHPAIDFEGKGFVEEALHGQGAKLALHAASRPPFANHAKDGAPTCLVVPARGCRALLGLGGRGLRPLHCSLRLPREAG